MFFAKFIRNSSLCCSSLQVRCVLDYPRISATTKKLFVDETNVQSMENPEKVYSSFSLSLLSPSKQ